MPGSYRSRAAKLKTIPNSFFLLILFFNSSCVLVYWNMERTLLSHHQKSTNYMHCASVNFQPQFKSIEFVLFLKYKKNLGRFVGCLRGDGQQVDYMRLYRFKSDTAERIFVSVQGRSSFSFHLLHLKEPIVLSCLKNKRYRKWSTG
jgi:hypothetical protein